MRISSLTLFLEENHRSTERIRRRRRGRRVLLGKHGGMRLLTGLTLLFQPVVEEEDEDEFEEDTTDSDYTDGFESCQSSDQAVDSDTVAVASAPKIPAIKRVSMARWFMVSNPFKSPHAC